MIHKSMRLKNEPSSEPTDVFGDLRLLLGSFEVVRQGCLRYVPNTLALILLVTRNCVHLPNTLASAQHDGFGMPPEPSVQSPLLLITIFVLVHELAVYSSDLAAIVRQGCLRHAP